MKIKLTTTCFVIAALLAPIASYAADSADKDSADHSKPVTMVKDSVITTKIKTKLAAEKISYAKDIKVDTDTNGVVRLSGTVATKEEADKVSTIARDTEGVKSVNNDIKVMAK